LSDLEENKPWNIYIANHTKKKSDGRPGAMMAILGRAGRIVRCCGTSPEGPSLRSNGIPSKRNSTQLVCALPIVTYVLLRGPRTAIDPLATWCERKDSALGRLTRCDNTSEADTVSQSHCLSFSRFGCCSISEERTYAASVIEAAQYLNVAHFISVRSLPMKCYNTANTSLSLNDGVLLYNQRIIIIVTTR
jgi:hypothetical protein